MKGTLAMYFYRLNPSWWNLPIEQREKIINDLDIELQKLRSSKFIYLAKKFLIVGGESDIGIIVITSQEESIFYTKFRTDKILGEYAALKKALFGITDINEQINEDYKYIILSAYSSKEFPSSNRLEVAIKEHIEIGFRHERNESMKYIIVRHGDFRGEYGVVFLVSSLHAFMEFYDDFLQDINKREIEQTIPIVIGQDLGYNLLLI